MQTNPFLDFLNQQVPKTPPCLQNPLSISYQEHAPSSQNPETLKFVDALKNLKTLKVNGEGSLESRPLKVAVLFSGGQAPGGHNVLWGLFDTLKKIHKDSTLLGIKGGPSGLLNQRTIEINEEVLSPYRNTGGFHLLGSGRSKIESKEELEKALEASIELRLDGLVIIGGDDSNTNAVILANYFKKNNCNTCVVGVPKTIDGDLKNEYVDISFGFDTATRVYSELIGNICLDAASSKKYYHFIKLMGRAASHVTIECAMQTQPNLALVGEEIYHSEMTLDQIVEQIADLIAERSKHSKNYGVILIPEGLIDFIPEFSKLNKEINALLAKDSTLNHTEATTKLSEVSQKLFNSLPVTIKEQLFLDRDPHGNIQLAKINTQDLLIQMTLEKLKTSHENCKLSALSHYLGYEGRCSMPSPFDASYTYSLGAATAVMITARLTGYMAAISGLKKHVNDWQVFALPITDLLNIEKRHGEDKAVIQKSLVDVDSSVFKKFDKERSQWRINDQYRSPGPIQFFGDLKVTDVRSFLLNNS